ncbi:hypothetical protein JXA32_14625, partial [Candidatus Sumerlaeota bacterium]|nr:hypothetical protein [Candidatus Sumerlaeota bacterium]
KTLKNCDSGGKKNHLKKSIFCLDRGDKLIYQSSDASFGAKITNNNPSNAIEILSKESKYLHDELEKYKKYYDIYPESLKELNIDITPPSIGAREWNYQASKNGTMYYLSVDYDPQYYMYESWFFSSEYNTWHSDS